MESSRRLPLVSPSLDAPASPARLARAPLERCTADDRFHDYVLEPYPPPVDFVGKLRSVNLLIEAFAVAGVEEAGARLVERVRGALGPFRTVWGVKQCGRGGELSFELYFYDRERTHADLSIARLHEVLAPSLRFDSGEPRTLPWHMFSLAFGAQALRDEAPASTQVYLDMRSYCLTPEGPRFENIYTFHDPRRDIDEVVARLRASIHFDARREHLGRLIPPSLLRCHRVCVANKRACDAIYFARIGTPALLEWLARESFCEGIARWAAHRAGDLEHLLWDVGVDFALDGSGALAVHKTGLYGSL